MARRAKGEGCILHIKPIACKACAKYHSCDMVGKSGTHCSKRDRRDRWLYQYVVKGPDGKSVRKALSATSRKVLEQKIEQLKEPADDGKRYMDVTLAQWKNTWIDTYLPGTVKPSTEKYYKSMLKHVPESLERQSLTLLSVTVLQNMLNELSKHGGIKGKGLSPKTVRGIRTTLISCLECAVDNGFLEKNLMKKTRPPMLKQKKIVYLSKEQSAELQRVADTGEYYHDILAAWRKPETRYIVTMIGTLIRLAFATGMRRGELFGLCWSNVDLDNKVIHVKNGMDHHGRIVETKTVNSIRQVSIDDETVNRLQKWKDYQARYIKEIGDLYDDKELVFTNSFGRSVNVDTFRSRYYVPLCKKANMPEGFTMHSIRHTHATLLLQAGVSPKVISERLGHSSVAFTLQVYAHATKHMERGAAEMIGTILDNSIKSTDKKE